MPAGKSDPTETMRNLFSLSQTERRLAHQYRRWASEARTQPERRKWQTEEKSHWSGALFHLRKCRDYQESIDV